MAFTRREQLAAVDDAVAACVDAVAVLREDTAQAAQVALAALFRALASEPVDAAFLGLPIMVRIRHYAMKAADGPPWPPGRYPRLPPPAWLADEIEAGLTVLLERRAGLAETLAHLERRPPPSLASLRVEERPVPFVTVTADYVSWIAAWRDGEDAPEWVTPVLVVRTGHGCGGAEPAWILRDDAVVLVVTAGRHFKTGDGHQWRIHRLSDEGCVAWTLEWPLPWTPPDDQTLRIWGDEVVLLRIDPADAEPLVATCFAVEDALPRGRVVVAADAIPATWAGRYTAALEADGPGRPGLWVVGRHRVSAKVEDEVAVLVRPRKAT